MPNTVYIEIKNEKASAAVVLSECIYGDHVCNYSVKTKTRLGSFFFYFPFDSWN